MRATEFTINIPVNIKINGDGDPEIEVSQDTDKDTEKKFVPPLQQKIELQKAALGKHSSVIDELISDEDFIGESSDKEEDNE